MCVIVTRAVINDFMLTSVQTKIPRRMRIAKYYTVNMPNNKKTQKGSSQETRQMGY